MNLQQYQEDTLKKFDEEYCNFEISERISITDMQNIKQFILSSLKGQLEVVVQSMLMEGIEAKMTPFQTTVNQYIRNRGEEIKTMNTNKTIEELLEQRNKDFDEHFSENNKDVYPNDLIPLNDVLATQHHIKSHIAETNKMIIEKVVEILKDKQSKGYELNTCIESLEAEKTVLQALTKQQ